MNIPKNLKYTKSHEWILMNEDSTASIGLTDYAQDALGDLVFVNLPEPEDELTAGEAFADVVFSLIPYPCIIGKPSA